MMKLEVNNRDRLAIKSFSIEENITYHNLKDLLTELKEDELLISNNAIEPDTIYLDFEEEKER